ncbi:MAG: dienelactone hydrolase family protein [Sulfobacillus thermotolerans]|nr:dienelactone hydrolase family protein [Sulfobacillus thermotolerans]
MKLQTQWITIEDQGLPMSAYQAKGERQSEGAPAILVIQEIWGPDEHIQDMANRYAEAGYLALAPDLYSKGGRPAALAFDRIEAVKRFFDTLPQQAWMDENLRQQYLNAYPDDEARDLKETYTMLFSRRDPDQMAKDLARWVDYLKSQGHDVASVGYCMGGALAFQLATLVPDLKGAVCNYGVAPDPQAMAHIQCPVKGFYGGEDHRITDQVPEVAKTMAALGKEYDYTIYPGAGHAFFNDTRASYAPDAARDTWAKTLAFFDEVFAKK